MITEKCPATTACEALLSSLTPLILVILLLLFFLLFLLCLKCVPEGTSSPRFTPSIPALLLPIAVLVPDPVPEAARGPCLGPDAAVPLPLALSRELLLATTGMSCLDWRMTNSSRRALLLEGAATLV